MPRGGWDNITDFYVEMFKSRCQSDDEEKINKGGDKRGRKSHYSNRIQTKELRQEDVDPGWNSKTGILQGYYQAEWSGKTI